MSQNGTSWFDRIFQKYRVGQKNKKQKDQKRPMFFKASPEHPHTD